MVVALASELSCAERSEAVAYDGVDVDIDILHIASLARFLRSSHNFKPKPERPKYFQKLTSGIYELRAPALR